MEHCINTRRLLLPVAWAVDSVPVRKVFCNLPLQKQTQSCKARYRWEVAPRVENLRESGERDTKKSQSSDNWRFDIAMSIPSEDEDCHEDRGSNQLDPVTVGWVGGGGGGGG